MLSRKPVRSCHIEMQHSPELTASTSKVGIGLLPILVKKFKIVLVKGDYRFIQIGMKRKRNVSVKEIVPTVWVQCIKELVLINLVKSEIKSKPWWFAILQCSVVKTKLNYSS